MVLILHPIKILQYQEKNRQLGSQDTRFHHFCTSWARVFFGEKLPIVTFVNLAVHHHTKKFKNSYRESEYVRFFGFGLNWEQIAGFSLLGQRIRRSPALAKNVLILSQYQGKSPS